MGSEPPGLNWAPMVAEPPVGSATPPESPEPAAVTPPLPEPAAVTPPPELPPEPAAVTTHAAKAAVAVDLDVVASVIPAATLAAQEGATQTPSPQLELCPDASGGPLRLTEQQQELVQLLHPGASRVVVTALHGDGTTVLGTASYDVEGRPELPGVTWLGSAEQLRAAQQRLDAGSLQAPPGPTASDDELFVDSQTAGIVRGPKYLAAQGAAVLGLVGACAVLNDEGQAEAPGLASLLRAVALLAQTDRKSELSDADLHRAVRTAAASQAQYAELEQARQLLVSLLEHDGVPVLARPRVGTPRSAPLVLRFTHPSFQEALAAAALCRLTDGRQWAAAFNYGLPDLGKADESSAAPSTEHDVPQWAGMLRLGAARGGVAFGRGLLLALGMSAAPSLDVRSKLRPRRPAEAEVEAEQLQEDEVTLLLVTQLARASRSLGVLRLEGRALPVLQLNGTSPTEELRLVQHGLGHASAAVLGSCLEGNTKLSTLVLSRNEHIMTRAFVHGLRRSAVTALDVSYNGLGAGGARLLAAALKEAPLVALSLHGNPIGAEGAAVLAAQLKHSRLTSLNLDGRPLPVASLRGVQSSVRVHSRWRTLDLSARRLGDASAIVIAECLKENRVLTTLLLGGNAIGALGFRAIAAALHANCTLTCLDVAYNGAGGGRLEAAAALGEALPRSALVTLDLDGFPLPVCELRGVGDAEEGGGQVAPRGAVIDLSCKGLHAPSAVAIAACIKGNKRLTKLNLAGNQLGAEGAAALAAVLRHTQLTSLDLSANAVGLGGAAGVAALLRVLPLTKMRTLNLKMCDLGTHRKTLRQHLAAAAEARITVLGATEADNPSQVSAQARLRRDGERRGVAARAKWERALSFGEAARRLQARYRGLAARRRLRASPPPPRLQTRTSVPVIACRDGSYLEGEFKDGRLHGRGKHVFTNGDEFDGEWREGKRHGRGTLTSANGAKTVACYRSGEPAGLGVQRSADGTEAWELLDGRMTRTISLEDAEQLAARISAEPEYPVEEHDQQAVQRRPAEAQTAGVSKVSETPGGWAEYQMDDGRTYYHHAEAQVTQWEEPVEGAPVRKRLDNGGYYEGEYSKDGAFHGHGTEVQPNGDTYTGEWVDGKKHGRGKRTYASGEVLITTYEAGYPVGIGVRWSADGAKAWETQGSTKKRSVSLEQAARIAERVKTTQEKEAAAKAKAAAKAAAGKAAKEEAEKEAAAAAERKVRAEEAKKAAAQEEAGVVDTRRKMYPNGDVYDGDWRGGKRHGRGKMIWATGNSYEGEWKDDQRHGEGKTVWANGRTHEGAYEKDRMHGPATAMLSTGWADVIRCEGDKTVGPGARWNADRTTAWELHDGKQGRTIALKEAAEIAERIGRPVPPPRREELVAGGYYEGGFSNDGKFHGHGKHTSANGETYEGEWVDGKKHGRGKHTQPGGGVMISYYEEGEPVGLGFKWVSVAWVSAAWETQDGKVVRPVPLGEARQIDSRIKTTKQKTAAANQAAMKKASAAAIFVAAATAVPTRFVLLDDLIAHGRLPRYGSKEDFVHPVTAEANANLCKPREWFNASKTVFIFVSHQWLRPAWDPPSRGHPDDEQKRKYLLILKAVRRLREGVHSPIPRSFRVALWLDYCCIDQDDAPASELDNLGHLIQACDLILTPIVDADHQSWQLPSVVHDYFSQYLAEGWREEYWSRGWCRIEAMLAAVKPVAEGRAELFRGAVEVALEEGRRPHVLFGTKELEENRPPIFLPPLLHTRFEEYQPEDGKLTRESDREAVRRLTAEARKDVKKLVVGWVGAYQGEGVGRGKKVLADGASYEGEFKDGVRHGHGQFVYANGAVYDGQYLDGMRHGDARYQFADGNVYEGEWRHHMRHGRAKLTFAKGVVDIVRYEADEPVGHGVRWSAGGREAWELQDGKKRRSISLHEAAEIAERIAPTAAEVPEGVRKAFETLDTEKSGAIAVRDLLELGAEEARAAAVAEMTRLGLDVRELKEALLPGASSEYNPSGNGKLTLVEFNRLAQDVLELRKRRGDAEGGLPADPDGAAPASDGPMSSMVQPALGPVERSVNSGALGPSETSLPQKLLSPVQE